MSSLKYGFVTFRSEEEKEVSLTVIGYNDGVPTSLIFTP